MTNVPLSEDRKAGAHELVRALSDDGIAISAAFWIFMSALDEWRLILVSPDVHEVGYRKILLKIDSKIQNFNGSSAFSIFDLEVRGEQDPHVIQWRENVPQLGHSATFVNSTFNDVHVQYAHVLFDRTGALK